MIHVAGNITNLFSTSRRVSCQVCVKLFEFYIVSYDAYCRAKSGQERTQMHPTDDQRATARHSHCTNGADKRSGSRCPVGVEHLHALSSLFSRSSVMQFKVERVQQFSCTRVISFGQSISLLQAAGPGRLESRLSFWILWHQGADELDERR